VVGQGNFQETQLGFFVDDCGDHYVALQNPNHTDGNFPTVINTPATFVLTFDFSSAGSDVDPTQVEYLDPTTDSVQSMPLQAAGAQMSLSVTLDPGELLLFKYKTEHPFARQ
jgi:hypothetical protein